MTKSLPHSRVEYKVPSVYFKYISNGYYSHCHNVTDILVEFKLH